MGTTRRKLGGLLFGLFYGGSLVNGFDRGLAYVARITGKEVLSFDQGPWFGLAVFWLSVVLMGFLAGYVGRSRMSGGVASVLGASLMVAMPLVSGWEVRFLDPMGLGGKRLRSCHNSCPPRGSSPFLAA